jgi:GAF domain-containing protein
MASASSPDELTTVFAHLHGMLLPTQDATTAVSRLARAVQQMIPSAAGAGVSLFDEHGAPVSTGATDTLVEAADQLQYKLGQGPCLSAWATGELQLVEDTTTDTRWAAWQAAAAEAGIRSVLSIPMTYRGRSRGAMKVYATTVGAFGDTEQQVLGLLAEAAATLLGVAQPVDAPVRLSASLKAAMHSREVIGFAVGVLMAREHLSAEAGRSLLLERARAQGRGVAEVATEILADAQAREQDRQR